MEDLHEKDVILLAQKGNIPAFETLVRKYDRQILRLAYQMLNHVQDAEDVYQEIFLLVFRKLHRFQFRSEFSTWLYRVAVNACINYRKKKSRSRELFRHAEYDGEMRERQKTYVDGGQTPEDQMLNRELAVKISRAVGTLPDRQKSVFLLRHYHGKKLQEIAQILGCSEGTVKNSLFRATRKMQQQLKKYKLHPEG